MRITPIGTPQVIMSNPGSLHNYFGWPTAARLQNGRIAVVASGFRLRHVCPFGKTVISYSEDEGKTYTAPAPIIDTVLDDRDGGIVAFGEKGVMVSSFNNTCNFQRRKAVTAYDLAYLDSVTAAQEQAALGASFRISQDYGITFGPIFKSPVTSPHGPTPLDDGCLLWVGRTFSPEDKPMPGTDRIEAHRILPDGSMEFVGQIDNIVRDGQQALSCEPHALQVENGRILTHIRVQGVASMFTLFQSESDDGGKTWSKPRQLLTDAGGAPAQLLRHSSGVLISTYGFRGEPFGKGPFGIRAMFSRDNGDTWDIGHSIYTTDVSYDLGYPSTVELSDGSLLTIFYARPEKDAPAVIMQQRWRMDA